MNRITARALPVLALTAALIAAPLASQAASGPQGDAHPHFQKFKQHRHQANGHWLRSLNLSQDQQDQIFKIRHDQAQSVYEQRKALKSARAELRSLSQADTFDADKAKQATDALGQAQAQLALLRAESGAKIRAVLTPEQRQTLQEQRARRMQHPKAQAKKS